MCECVRKVWVRRCEPPVVQAETHLSRPSSTVSWPILRVFNIVSISTPEQLYYIGLKCIHVVFCNTPPLSLSCCEPFPVRDGLTSPAPPERSIIDIDRVAGSRSYFRSLRGGRATNQFISGTPLFSRFVPSLLFFWCERTRYWLQHIFVYLEQNQINNAALFS